MWSAGTVAILALGVGLAAAAVGVWLAARAGGRGFHAAMGTWLALSGASQTAGALGLLGPLPDTFVLCVGLVIQLLLPAGLFWVSATLLGPPDSGVRRRARVRAWLALVLCILSAALAWTSTTLEVGLTSTGAPHVALGPLGRGVFALHVVLLALGIAQFEALLRAVPYPQRYSLKLLLPAIAAPAVYQIFFASQILLSGSAPLDRTLPSLVLLSAALGLLALGLRVERTGLRDPVYVAPHIVYGSVTFLVIGLYLLAVGALGELLRKSWPGVGRPLSEALLLLALLGLAVALVSRTARAEMQRFLSRYFYRSKYDYREKWLEVTDAFESCRTVDEILDRLLDVVGRTFGSGRIAVWIRYEADDRFHQVRSVNLESPPAPIPPSHPVLRALAVSDLALKLETLEAGAKDRAEWVAFREATRAVLCAPIRTEAKLIGFLTLGPERGGDYGPDDRNLLRAVCHHAGVLLAHARMSEDRREAAELEALHRVSAFCVHDLKNLAASLSLVARNAEKHGTDPAFQQSALQTVSRTSDKIMGLVGRLSRRSAQPAPVAEPGDVWGAIDETLASLDGTLRSRVRREGGPVPPVAATRDELHQLLLNLLLNAADALEDVKDEGPARQEIRIGTAVEADRVVLRVADRGLGLSNEAVGNLFRPFRSTKDGGLGLGAVRVQEDRRIPRRTHPRAKRGGKGHGVSCRASDPSRSRGRRKRLTNRAIPGVLLTLRTAAS